MQMPQKRPRQPESAPTLVQEVQELTVVQEVGSSVLNLSCSRHFCGQRVDSQTEVPGDMPLSEEAHWSEEFSMGGLAWCVLLAAGSDHGLWLN